jgi:coproporphyrinogen III oxidase-like Fe-S oxidoreductase
MFDYLTLGLRLREGVSLAEFARRFDANLLDLLGDDGRSLLDHGLLELDSEADEPRLRIAADRQLITNEILVRLEESLLAQARRETSALRIAAR